MKRLTLIAVASILAVAPGMGLAAESFSWSERVAARESVEKIYWSHRIWPDANPGLKPPYESIARREAALHSIDEALRMSEALERFWHRPIRAAQLQAELDRLARNTKSPSMLAELYAALGNDPRLVAETIALPLLADRQIRTAFESDRRFRDSGISFERWWGSERERFPATDRPLPQAPLRLPPITTVCDDNTWQAVAYGAPGGRDGFVSAWTGTEMIVWGGEVSKFGAWLDAGSRYDPATDGWTATGLGPGAPSSRIFHTAFWTGNEMIVWGGIPIDFTEELFTGGRYDPAHDLWKSTSTGKNSPGGRYAPSAVWTGAGMLIWGGAYRLPTFPLGDGAIYCAVAP